jgi:hypothetical protein
MSIAFVLGNGLSRQGLPLNNLQQAGTVYGCNALYREFVPDVLVATDRPIATAIQNSGYARKHKFYTRRPLENSGAVDIPKPWFGYSSGPVATALAAQDGHTKVYLVGFDMGPNLNQKFNNIYAGTEFYKPQDSVPTFTGNWMRQIKDICKNFGHVKFLRVCGSTTARLPDLDNINNLDHVTLEQFLHRINNVEEF